MKSDYEINRLLDSLSKSKFRGSFHLNDNMKKYCYEKGDFIHKVSMEEFIEMCSKFGAQAGMTNEEMKEHCKKLFPTLKRWQIK